VVATFQGRIGRTFLRNLLDQEFKDLEVVCINE
jgi:glyceraldehyde-3-phosphate dehydrogenase/erythrose-4-phosphate dehydrogenase